MSQSRGPLFWQVLAASALPVLLAFQNCSPNMGSPASPKVSTSSTTGFEPQPVPGPTPAPVPAPNPEPQPNPEPTPSPTPSPNPEPNPNPGPTPNPQPQPAPQDTAGHSVPRFSDLTNLNTWRRQIWAATVKCGSDQDWEVCFDGSGIPGMSQMGGHLDWDNPIDDDWVLASTRRESWSPDLVAASGERYMRVDRTFGANVGKTGHFWRRDEFLRAADGFEAEFRVRILPNSGVEGVKFHFFDDRDNFMMSFGPNSIGFHTSLSSGAASVQVNRSNTAVTTFRMVKAKGTGEVTLYANGARLFAGQKLMPGGSNLMDPAGGSYGRIAPRIGFGDNNNSVTADQKGAYEIYNFRYRRQNRVTARVSPALAPAQVCATPLSWKVLRQDSSLTAYSGSLGAQMTDMIGNHFGRSFELDLKLLEAPDVNAGYSFEYADKLGGILLTIYSDRIALKADIRPGLPSLVQIPNFNALESNRYRLVRSSNGLYWSLYVNEDPVPVLTDVKSSGVSLRDRTVSSYVPAELLMLGPYVTPALPDLVAVVDALGRTPTMAKAQVSLLRWLDQAVAPNHCP